MKISIPKFESKKELYKYIVENKIDLIELKKSELKKCDPLFYNGLNLSDSISLKSDNESYSKDSDDIINRTIVGNTYYWLDSHDDVHVSGCFGVSIKQKGAKKINHLHDHVHQLSAKVGKFVDVYEKEIKWSELGVDKEGFTEALMADSQIYKNMNPNIFQMYKDGDVDQHSVGMYYVNVSLAVNDPDMKEEFSEWVKIIDKIGNKEEAEKQGFMFIVKEAKLIEISCVLNGSNILTPTIDPQKSSQSKGNSNPDKFQLEQQAEAEAKAKKDELIKVLTQMHY